VSPQIMQAEEEILALLRDRYLADGFQFIARPSRDLTPGFLGDYLPDAIALKGDGGVVIEIKAGRDRRSRDMRDVAGRFALHPEWRFELVLAENFGADRRLPPGLAELKPLSNLRFISFKHVALSPDSLKHIAQLTQLEILGLDDTNVTDEQLTDLAALKHLRTLWLSKTRITDRSVEHILKVPSLQNLYLHGSQITEAGADKIREKMPNCNVGR